jgi:hypothetical protein
MLLNKVKLRKASSRVALLLATGSLLATGIAPAQALDATPLYINFEASDPLKNVGAAGGAFGGSSFEVKAGTNLTTGDSLHFTKNGEPWGGINILKETSTPYGYTAADKKVVTFDYWSPDAVASPVMLKLEAPGATYKAVEAQPGFNTITVDFTGVDSWGGDYTKLIIFPNFKEGADTSYTGAPAVPNTGQVYEIDNISINGGTAADVYVPQAIATSTLVTFEANDTLGAGVVGEAAGAKKQGSFAGTATTIEDAPTGGNGGKALKIVKNGEPYAGVNVLAFEPATTRVTNATHKTVTFNYYSPKADSPVRIELRGYPNALGKTVTAPLGWSKITVDFTDVDGWTSTEAFANVILFPDFDVAAAGDVFYVDNLGINGATTPAIPVGRSATSTLLTFETGDTLGAAAAGPGFEGAVAVIKDAAAGGNGGKALEIEKAGQPWAGIVLATAPSNIKFLDAANKTVTMNYYSPQTVATPVQFQLEATDGSKINQAVEAAPGWSKLTIDFTASYNDAKQYTIARIYPNFVNTATEVPGYTGAPAVAILPVKFYFVDNVGFNGAATPAIAVPREATSTLLTFETGDVLGAAAATPPTAQKPQGGFEGATTSIDVAPTGGNGGNALKITKNPGAQIYAGATLIKFGTDKRVTDGANKVITFNYYSPKANSPVNVELRAYPNALGKIINAPLGWSKMSFDFTDVAGWTSTEEFTLVSIFPDFNQPAGATATSYFVDNLAFNGAVTPEIPAVSVPRAATSTLLTFETADTLGAKVVGDSTLAKPEGGFEGAVTTIENAPALGNGGKALKIVKGVGAATYAGANIIRFGADKRVTNGNYSAITFNYYSPKTTSNVRVEVSGFPNAVGKTVAAPKGWSKITVDFTGVAGWDTQVEFVSVILFPDFDVAGAGDAFYVDNLAFNGATTPAIPVPAVKPSVKTAATVAGTAKSAKTLTAGKGSWNGTATIAYTYKWYRCSVSSTKTATAAPTSSAKCATISGATKSTYKLASADVGKYVRVLITAKNSAGTAYSLSKTTSKVVK